MAPPIRALWLTGVLSLAFWSSYGTAQPAESSPEPAAIVRLVRDRFAPQTVRIRPGESVRWENASLDTHTVTIDPASARFPEDSSLPRGVKPVDSGPLGLGQTFTLRFEVPGTYRYFCQLHEAQRMVGSVIVEER